MSTVTDTLGAPQDTQQADVRLLNAKRYGLTEANLSQFMEMMTSLRNPKPAEAEGANTANTDVTTLSDTDYIKSYIRQRITDRLSSTMGRDNNYGTFPQDMPTNSQDLILEMVGTPRRQSNDLSGLLNMHFDLNTLQMFS
ncbi:hypothetical protein [Magnetovibrio blakemorei]|uniref:Uncharacterized protein n=1 Tax=Magnetovibrio blakemorei TaxID=28181 RepID=A0A1E5Q5M4_9PROT|nr:hypothetical protein [Magnetovibrio blakemorei]OEJ65691.1 hypothetical protein BEN30_13655 [Magnetovibrio blakemorei]